MHVAVVLVAGSALLVAGASMLGTVGAADPPNGFYASRYDHLNVETILGSKRLVTNYADCLLGRKPCPPQGKELIRVLPEALRTTCARCTEKQKVGALRIVRRLQKEYPDIWRELKERWDPNGEYEQQFEQAIINNNQVQGLAPATTPARPASVPAIIFDRFGDSSNDIPQSTDKVAPAPPVELTTRLVRSSTPVPMSVPVVTTTRTLPPSPPRPSPSPPVTAPPPVIRSVATEAPVRNTVATSTTPVPPQRPVTQAAPPRTTTYFLRPLFAPQINLRSHWLDQLSSKVLTTAGRLADMLLTSVEVVVGNRNRE